MVQGWLEVYSWTENGKILWNVVKMWKFKIWWVLARKTCLGDFGEFQLKIKFQVITRLILILKNWLRACWRCNNEQNSRAKEISTIFVNLECLGPKNPFSGFWWASRFTYYPQTTTIFSKNKDCLDRYTQKAHMPMCKTSILFLWS